VFHSPKTLKRYLSVTRSFATALKLAGIRDFHFHDLRHTYASLGVMNGKIDLPTLSKLLGHKNIKMTMRYANLSNEHLTKAAHAMDEVYNPTSGTKLVQSNEKRLTDESQPFEIMERATGFEPATPSLGSLYSTN